MYALNGFNLGPTNPNSVRKPDDGKPIVCDRFCEDCSVKWRGELRDECWSCGEIPGKVPDSKAKEEK
jgi:hypothetical protein